MGKQEKGFEYRMEEARRVVERWWWVMTLACAMCNVPIWMAQIQKNQSLEAEIESVPDSIDIRGDEAVNVGGVLAALALNYPVDEEYLAQLVEDNGISSSDSVPSLVTIFRSSVVGRFDEENRELEFNVQRQADLDTAMHEFAHAHLELSESTIEAVEQNKEFVGFTILKIYSLEGRSQEFDNLHDFLHKLLFDEQSGNQAYTGLLDDIPFYQLRLVRFSEMVNDAEEAVTIEERRELNDQAFEYYRQNLHKLFENSSVFESRLGIHEAYASLVEYVAKQDFAIPPEIEDIVCPPLDCDELTGRGSYQYISYEDSNEATAVAVFMAMMAIYPVIIKAGLVIKKRMKIREKAG